MEVKQEKLQFGIYQVNKLQHSDNAMCGQAHVEADLSYIGVGNAVRQTSFQEQFGSHFYQS